MQKLIESTVEAISGGAQNESAEALAKPFFTPPLPVPIQTAID